ncbi:uncharacterized protein LOC128395571 [Panonychus citri]|uniref:uncharacterized protein LOC128395571 n=1 Tax=Panonychus citri TaxID=50023 RepID=UPI00230724B1|nr:uncharacterized protein LOC128395571 [Panonychus citri]
MVNGFSMAKLTSYSLICFVVINFLSGLTNSASTQSSSSSSSSTATSPLSELSSTSSTTSTVKIETELVSSESKNNEDKNDLLKDLKDLGPDDLAKLIRAKKEKELDEFKSKITNIRGNREVLDSYRQDRQQQQQQQQKGAPIVQQQEDDYQNSGDSVANEDNFDDENDSPGLPANEKGVKKPKYGNLGSLLPFLPNPGSVMTMMVKPIDRPEQMVCDCYNPGKTSSQQPQQQQQQLQITQQQQQQIWPPMVSNRKVPMIPPMAPMAPIQPMQPPISLFPPSPFSFIGQHFANKPMSSHKKKQLNPLSLLLMGLTGGKRKRTRPRPRPVYPSYPPFQQQQQQSSLASILPGFEPNEPELMYPVQQVYNIKGNGGSGKGGGGGRKGRKRPRKPYNNLPPPPSSIKGRSKGKGSEKGKWHWTMTDDYKDLTQGFNEQY